MSLNHSSLVKKSSHCASMYNKITTQMAKAVLDHENWKQTMSDHAEKLGKLETKARKLIFKGQFCKAMLDIATGLVIVRGTGYGDTKTVELGGQSRARRNPRWIRRAPP